MEMEKYDSVRVSVASMILIAALAAGLAIVPASLADDSAVGDQSTPEADDVTGYTQNGTITLGNNREDPVLLPRCEGEDPQDSPEEPVTWGDGCVTIDVDTLEYTDNGTKATWSASSENVTFPWIKTTDVDADYANVTMSTPNGLNGTIDLETGKVTANGQFDIRTKVRGSLIGDADCQTQTNLSLTTETGAQGIVEGERLRVNESSDTGTVTLVDDSFTVPNFEPTSGSRVVCAAAGSSFNLPAETPGDNTIELEFAVDLDE